MEKVRTLWQAIQEKRDIDAELFARIDAREAEEARVAAILRDHPEIGVLNGCRFYTYQNNEYRESCDPADLVAATGAAQ